MKKNAIKAVVLAFVLFLQASCLAQNAEDVTTEPPNEAPPTPASFVTTETESATTEPPDETTPDQTPGVAQRQEIAPSGLSDVELVELFILYLNDEIPLFYKSGKTERYSDFNGGFSPSDVGTMNPKFYVLDMDGDGDLEFCYYLGGGLNIIKYDSSSDCFRFWLVESIHHEPIGTGQMYYRLAGLGDTYAYEVYDKNANLVECIVFRREQDYYDIEADIGYHKYYISHYVSDDGEFMYDDRTLVSKRLVSESEWEEEIAFLLELRDNGPERLSYQDLLDMVK